MTDHIIEVEMHAFGQGAIRRVTIPAGRPVTLGTVFERGQNDFCADEDLAQELPSVSVGDIIRLDGARYVVAPTGFVKVATTFQPPADDRGGMYAYGLKEGAA